ncbi:MAG: transposase [Pirellulaceae bacterium]|nr:transposase [Pirellulaceae bacterium]
MHPLLYILLLTTYCNGDSLPEKFEAARSFYVVCCPKRKRPGVSFAGFEKAVAKLPMPVLRTLTAAIRGQIKVAFADRWKVGNFIPFGCDGTRQACPRTEELERRLGTFGKEGSSPMIWNTSIVHLTLGLPFCWRLGKGGKASERSHLIHMLRWLPAAALIVADAGYVGYEVVATMIRQNVSFLIRMSSMATFYSETNEPLDEFREGIVYYWPKTQENDGKPPLRGRLMRIHSPRHKTDVWLFTNVEDPKRLSLEMAGTCYRWRWENEGFFRTYKRSLKKVVLMSRTLRSVHREAEASMIATQLLLCQGALAMPAPAKGGLPVMCSPRGVLLEARRDILAGKALKRLFSERIRRAQRERRVRTSAKQKREWPRRKPHTAPHPPLLLMLTIEQKIKIHEHLQAA